MYCTNGNVIKSQNPMFLCDPLELCVAWYQALVDPTKSTELREFVQEVVHSEIALRNEEIIRRLRQEQIYSGHILLLNQAVCFLSLKPC